MDFLDSNTLRLIANGFWLLLAFVLGAAVGSFLNVAVARLPFEKSLLWPSSRCGVCHKPIHWYDNLPLISYLVLRGRCRACGQQYSSRYFWLELFTALGFAGLMYVEVILNLFGWPDTVMARQYGIYPGARLVAWAFHALLFSLLLTASVCDLRTREIPLQITLVGTLFGLIGSVLLPWPWPHDATLLPPVPPVTPSLWTDWPAQHIPPGIYPAPFWWPLPEFFAPGGNWQTGLATGLAGALMGTVLLRIIGFLFSTGLGKDALGLGDADLMMMAGAFIGWQAVVVAFFVSIVPALLFGLFQMIFRGDNSLPFGPSLALGVLATLLGWPWLTENVPAIALIFLNGYFALFLFGAAAGLILVLSFVMRLLRS